MPGASISTADVPQVLPDSAPAEAHPPVAARHSRISPDSGWLLDLREIWQYRELLATFAGRDLKVRYKQTVLGVIWVVLQPLVMALVFTFVFGRVLRIPFPGGIPPLLFIFAGLTGFALFRDIVTRSSSSLVSNRQLVSKIYFPRVLLPASAVLNSLVDFAVGLTVFLAIWLVLALTVSGGEGVNVPTPGWHLLLWPLCVIVLIMISLGVGMMATAMAVSWRDVGHVVPVLLMIALYASPVMYDIGFLFDAPPAAAATAADGEIARAGLPAWQRTLYFANPLAGLLAMYRYSLIGSGAVSWLAFGYSALVGMLLMVIGAVVFKRMERRFADVI